MAKHGCVSLFRPTPHCGEADRPTGPSRRLPKAGAADRLPGVWGGDFRQTCRMRKLARRRMTDPTARPLIDRQQILAGDPVGQTYQIPDGSSEQLGQFLWRGAVDIYCPECKQNSVFKLQGPGYGTAEEAKKLPEQGVVIAHATCQRESKVCPGYPCGAGLYVCFLRAKDQVTKIGQHPSKATVDFGTLDPAFSELTSEFRAEIGKAVGLRSHGIGVGSFVYLRRVFEALLEQARVKAAALPDWEAGEYSACRVRERIALLAKHLPARLVDCADLYSVLSKGIHELTEDECLEQFDVVFQGIQLILSQRREDKQYEAITKKVRAVASKHSGSS